MSTLTASRTFDKNAFEQSAFWQDRGNGRGALNIEGIVAIDGESLVANLDVDSTSASYGGTYIGKDPSATNGDFDVAYASANTLTLSNYPSPLTGLHADDIELVRQIDNTGAVVETYSRDNAAMSIAGNVLTVTGAAFGATDTFVILTNIQSTASGSGSGSSVGGGNNTYSNASGDFIATITDSTKNITITGLPFTLEAKHVVMGAIKKIAVTTNVVSDVALTDVVVAGGVITLADEPDFATGDVVVVSLIGPDKAYDSALDSQLTTVLNPNYSHYTSVEYLINESNLGIGATSDGGDADTLTDSSETFTAETVAEGYTAYQVTDGESALVDADSLYGLAGDGGASAGGTSVETATLSGAATWDTKAYVLPECKRFVIPAEGYNYLTIDILLDSQDEHNSCYCKIYATLDENADDTDDIYWKDISNDLFGAAQLSADGIGDGARAVTQGIYFVDVPTPVLKYMVKIVAECDNGTQNNEFDILIKKSS